MAYTFAAASSQYMICTIPEINAPLTMSAWFYSSIPASAQAFVALNNLSNSQRFTLAIDNTATVGATSFGAADDSWTARTTATAAANTWQHGCGVVANTSSRTAYINGGGGVTQTKTTTTAISGVNSVIISGRYNAGGYGAFWDGRIAEVGVWSATLAASEVASLGAGVSPSLVRPQSLVFYAPLIREIVDARGGRAITNTNGATVVTHPRVYA